MFQKMTAKLRGRLLAEKLLWSLGIIIVYLLGRRMPLATVAIEALEQPDRQDFVTNLSAVTGGNFFEMTLFSLGLGPWMTSMILWRFLIFFNRFKQLTQRRAHYVQMTLMLVIAIIQALGMTSAVAFRDSSLSPLVLRLATLVILISGTCVLSWLAHLNSHKGLGGAIVIILANLILTSLSGLTLYLQGLSLTIWSLLLTLVVLFLAVSCLIVFTIVIYKAEYRLQIRRITIISEFAEATYIPIRLTPAGAMPYMYGMTLMILPPLMLNGLRHLFPKVAWLSYLADHLTLSQLPGVLIYISLLFMLAFGFAYYHYDPIEIAKSMRISGDYIEGIRPGRATERYIRHRLNQMTFIGAVITSLIGGFPLLLVLGNPDKVSLALLINNGYIITTMMLGVIEQLDVLRSWRKYHNII